MNIRVLPIPFGLRFRTEPLRFGGTTGARVFGSKHRSEAVRYDEVGWSGHRLDVPFFFFAALC